MKATFNERTVFIETVDGDVYQIGKVIDVLNAKDEIIIEKKDKKLYFPKAIIVTLSVTHRYCYDFTAKKEEEEKGGEA